MYWGFNTKIGTAKTVLFLNALIIIRVLLFASMPNGSHLGGFAEV